MESHVVSQLSLLLHDAREYRHHPFIRFKVTNKGAYSTLEEYRRFTGSRRNRAGNELMIEAFDRNAIKIPEEKPDWLWSHIL